MEKRDERLENETYRNEILSRMRTFSTPELCDGAGLYHVMDYHIKSRVAGKKIVGTAVTVDVPMGEGGIIPDAILMLVKAGECTGDRRKRLSRLFLQKTLWIGTGRL